MEEQCKQVWWKIPPIQTQRLKKRWVFDSMHWVGGDEITEQKHLQNTIEIKRSANPALDFPAFSDFRIRNILRILENIKKIVLYSANI